MLAAGILAVSAILAGCASTPKCTTAACADEAGMADKITKALRDTPGIEYYSVSVQYRNGVVYLYGIVSTTPQRADIERIASETSGGKKVVNSIEARGRY
jgi:osmotically-inducible protein OsmY